MSSVYNHHKEKTKSYLDNKKVPYLSNYNANIGGALGAFFHDLWMNPCEVLKQRLQMKNSPYINQSYARIANSIYRQEGLRAFYLSFGTQLSMNGMDFNKKIKSNASQNGIKISGAYSTVILYIFETRQTLFEEMKSQKSSICIYSLWLV